ncbi:MAG: ComEC/Rec2 family competence protein, partial [Nocardioides sp.]
VSGTNLTLLVGFLLVASRWCGVRGRGLYLVGAVGIVGFVLVARFEPSVMRAAAMGTVGLLAMGLNGRQRGGRALGVAVLMVLLVDPLMVEAAGFALSVLATAGIVYLSPVWRDALSRWLPRWLAAAIAVPAAAQLVCAPLVAALSAQVSLVGIAANVLVAPAVGPATVLGLTGGLVGMLSAPLASVAGTLAGWCASWIILVARHGADLPTPWIAWGTDPVRLLMLCGLCVAIALVAPHLLGRQRVAIGVAVSLVMVIMTRLPTPGWPPARWVFAACDVGQGDALVLNAGDGAAVVIDAGPDPTLVDQCLRRLEITAVPLLVLTHFHADHVDGLPGVLRGRRVGAVETSGLLAPVDRVGAVREQARQAGLVPALAQYGVTRRVGQVRIQTLWPRPAGTGSPSSVSEAAPDDPGPTDSYSASADPTRSTTANPNNASVVILAEVAGVRLLLTGDIEPEAQGALAEVIGQLRVDVLKLPHHGSRFQDFEFLAGLRARIAVVSAGLDNDYGHPHPDTLSSLAQSGAVVGRTDTDGDVAVTIRGGDPVVISRDFTHD